MHKVLQTEIKDISARKQEILAAAQQLFSEKGYVAASMRDLATALDIRPASLYSHYRSKDEILWEIAIRSAQEFYEQVLPLAEERVPPEERLSNMTQAHTKMILRNLDAYAIFSVEWKRLEPEKREIYAQVIATYEGTFINVLHEGIVAGSFREGDSRFLTSMLLSSVNWMTSWYRPDGKMTPEEIAQTAADFVLNGLRA